MSVVVTGSAGFIGAHLVSTLGARGNRVIGIDRRASRGGHSIEAELTRDSTVVDDLLREADAVFHLAALPGVRDRGPGIVRRRLRDNVEALDRVLSVVPLETPVIVTSSSSVYGGARHAGVIRASRETDALAPRGGYARSKVAAERRSAMRAAAGGEIAIARPFTVAGEGQRPDMALARWIASVRIGEPIQIIGSPDRTRDVTDVRDVVAGLVAMAERNFRGVCNLGSGLGRTLDELLDAVLRAADRDAIREVVPAEHEEPPATLADVTRMRTELGINPNTDLNALVRRQIAAQRGQADETVEVA